MIGQLGHILTKIYIPHLNVLFLLGLALFGGTIGGRLFQKLRIPQVVGYITIGIIIGESGLKIVDHNTVKTLAPFNYFALSLVGFMIGGELKREVLHKYGKQLINILLFEGIAAFLAVTVLVGVAGGFLFGDWKLAWSLGLLLGAIASATAPAATTAVLREYKSRGPLTRTVLGIVAMDDALALFLFAIAASFAGSISGSVQEGIVRTFIHPLYEIGGSLIIGIVSGLLLSSFLKRYTEEDRLLTFSIGAILLVSGLAIATHVDMLLATMTMGVIVINFNPRKSKEVFKLVEAFTPPIYVLFFTLVGAELNVAHLSLPIVLLALVYIIARSSGKAIGSIFGARLSGASESVRRYLPLCLFSQAGVALGLSILASHYFPGLIGNAVVIIVTATAFILEIMGPAFVKLAITKAGEVGLNITEDDLIRRLKVEEIMDKNPPLIHKEMSLDKILKAFSKSSNLYYPVVDADKRLLGVITVDNIKNIFMEAELSNLLLAIDVMEPAVASVTPEDPVALAKESLDKYNLEYLPVTTRDRAVAGFIERRMFNRVISTKVMESQRKADVLERT